MFNLNSFIKAARNEINVYFDIISENVELSRDENNGVLDAIVFKVKTSINNIEVNVYVKSMEETEVMSLKLMDSEYKRVMCLSPEHDEASGELAESFECVQCERIFRSLRNYIH